jgi:hypothetical protein
MSFVQRLPRQALSVAQAARSTLQALEREAKFALDDALDREAELRRKEVRVAAASAAAIDDEATAKVTPKMNHCFLPRCILRDFAFQRPFFRSYLVPAHVGSTHVFQR